MLPNETNSLANYSLGSEYCDSMGACCFAYYFMRIHVSVTTGAQYFLTEQAEQTFNSDRMSTAISICCSQSALSSTNNVVEEITLLIDY